MSGYEKSVPEPGAAYRNALDCGSRIRSAAGAPWMASFVDSGRRFVAIGRNPKLMTVFRVDPARGGRVVERPAMTFPSCLHFLYPTRVSGPWLASAAEVARFGAEQWD